MRDLRMLVVGLSVALLISVGVSAVPSEPRRIQVTATPEELVPSRIELKIYEPVEITFESLDAERDFICAALKLGRVVFEKNKPTKVAFTPDREGAFEFTSADPDGSTIKGSFVISQ